MRLGQPSPSADQLAAHQRLAVRLGLLRSARIIAADGIGREAENDPAGPRMCRCVATRSVLLPSDGLTTAVAAGVRPLLVPGQVSTEVYRARLGESCASFAVDQSTTQAWKRQGRLRPRPCTSTFARFIWNRDFGWKAWLRPGWMLRGQRHRPAGHPLSRGGAVFSTLEFLVSLPKAA
jgi:hypothetical protein